MNKKNTILSIWIAVILGLSLIISSIFISNAFYKLRASHRYVTVKGLAEREVDANLVIWPIKFVEVDNNLASLNSKIENKKKIIIKFLKDAGLNEENISTSLPSVVDFSSTYNYSREKSEYRYQETEIITVRSQNVPQIKKIMENSSELINQGIVLSGEDYNSRTEFLFTGLNDIKPSMIEEATKNAREAAEKFAQDSNSKVGKIKNAKQGYFTINDLDSNTKDKKNIRVVTTLEYYLDD